MAHLCANEAGAFGEVGMAEVHNEPVWIMSGGGPGGGAYCIVVVSS